MGQEGGCEYTKREGMQNLRRLNFYVIRNLMLHTYKIWKIVYLRDGGKLNIKYSMSKERMRFQM